MDSNGCLPSSNNASSALNVIIEAQVSVAHLFQDGKRLICLEVLKLNQAVGKAVLRRCTELLNHLHMLFASQPFLFGTLHEHQLWLNHVLVRCEPGLRYEL